jgi:hypothetical protein
MLGQLFNNSNNEDITKHLNTLTRIFLDHNHDKLNSREVTGGGGGGSFSAGAGARMITDGTGTTDIDCGFEPKMIKIVAVKYSASTNTGISWGTATSDSDNHCIFRNRSGGGNWENAYNASYIIFVANDGNTLQAKATLSAIGSTGFTLNFTEIEIDCRYQWEAWG